MSKFFKDVQKRQVIWKKNFQVKLFISFKNQISDEWECQDGNLNAMGKNIAGILGYSQLLIEGGGRAQKPNELETNFFKNWR